jgi:uncharacterized oxidoreductase
VTGQDDATRFDPAALAELARSVLTAVGATGPIAGTVADSLVDADLCGHDSHGVRRLVPYVAAVESGLVDPRAEPTVRQVAGATAVVDGHRGFGQPAARRAVGEALSLVGRHHVGAVVIRECNHIGRLGEYVEALARRGMIGLAFCNVDPTVAPFGGRERRLGTNPLAWAAPGGPEGPVVLDWATAATAEGKLAVALARGEAAAPGAVLDAGGAPTTDPAAFYDGGALLPFGGHKGYGLGVLIEIVGGLLSGAGISSLPGYAGTSGPVLVALDVAAFVPTGHFEQQVAEFRRVLRATPPARGSAGVQVPGEPEARARAERTRDGIPVPAAIWQELTELAGRVGAAVPAARAGAPAPHGTPGGRGPEQTRRHDG